MGWKDAPAVSNKWQSAPAAKPKETSFWQGVKEGAQVPFNNAARLLEYGLDKVGLADDVNALGSRLGMASSVAAAEAEQKRQNARARYAPSNTGKFVGNIVGTLPTAAIPGGVFAQGAMAGGLLTNKRDPIGVGQDMLLGGIAGKVGDKAVRGVAKVVAPKVSQSLRTLRNAGVKVMPGQAVRESQGLGSRLLTSFEDRAESLPGPTGQLIRAGRKQASEAFASGGVNSALSEIGKKLPGSIKPGHKAVEHAQEVVGKAYDDALAGMDLIPDQQLSEEVTGLIANAKAGGLSEPHFKRLQQTVQNVVLRRYEANGGKLSGQTFKDTISELRGTAAKYSKSSMASEQEYGDVVGQLADSLESAAIRSSPKPSSEALLAADRAYAKLVRVEGAAKNAKGGVYSPGQLSTSIRNADNSVRKRAVAAGNGLMQDYASAGENILPSSFGDSGTAPREALWNLTPWVMDLASYYPYKAASVVSPLLTDRQAGPAAQAFSDILRLSAPAASKAAPVAFGTFLNDR